MNGFAPFVDFGNSAHNWRGGTGFREDKATIGCWCRGTPPISDYGTFASGVGVSEGNAELEVKDLTGVCS